MDPNPAFHLIANSGPSVRQGEPIVIGVPLPRGAIKDHQSLQLCSREKVPVPCDVSVLDRWGDNSARWALLAFRARTKKSTETFTFYPAAGSERALQSDKEAIINIHKSEVGYRIDTGPAVFTLAKGRKWPIQQVYGSDGSPWLNEMGTGLAITISDGNTFPCRVDEIAIETEGALRVVAAAKGEAHLPCGKRIEIDWRLEFFGGLPILIVHNTIRNPHRAKHRGGYWELGDAGSLLVREAVFKLEAANPLEAARGFCSPEPSKDFCSVDIPFELYQDSSGGDNYRSHNHVNREGKIPIAFRGYRMGNSGDPAGLRASPIVMLSTACGPLSLGVRHFWQNFPKAIETSESSLAFGLFPRQWNDLHELQGGEQKTHSFAISFGPDGVTNVPLDWFRQPLLPSIDPEWVTKTQAIPYLTPANRDPHKTYIQLVDSAIEGKESFEKKRELIDEYGWRNFGDIYADHEAIYAEEYHGPDPLVSHYNNQYDAIAGFCYQWLRSGDWRWWTQFNELAAHVVDIDIYHTDEDKPAYNHGLFWHTFHYVDAGRSTHRSYPRIGKSNGGGPANEHVYTTGLILHYFVTGNPQSRDAAIDLARFITDIDDGSKTPYRWLSRSDTGLASASRSPDYHGPGRGPANSVNALVDAHRLTRNPIYLQKAEQLIRRVSHPKQNIEKLSLLDAENRWFYTMFLQTLGKYLNHKEELDTTDGMFHYARKVLLHFADWMARTEYPYLGKPEILEYPTETWAAQDMRKSEVFKVASIYAEEKDLCKLEERASYFHKTAVDTLIASNTHSLCRPTVLMLSFGWMDRQSNFKRQSYTGNPSFPDMGSHATFVTQKSRAIYNGKLIIIIGILFISAIATLLLGFLRK